MRLVETTKFKRQRKKIKESYEKKALTQAVSKILDNPDLGKHLKGEFKDLLSFSYTAKGQNRRLIYKKDKEAVVLMSFGPR